MTVDDVLAGPVIADPFTRLHCCPRSDGGAAVLTAAEDVVRDCRTDPVWVLGTGEHVSHAALSEWPDFTVSPAAESGRRAFGRARVRPDEMDLAEIYDAFTCMTPVTLKDLGFCPKGEGGAFVGDGRLVLLLGDGGAGPGVSAPAFPRGSGGAAFGRPGDGRNTGSTGLVVLHASAMTRPCGRPDASSRRRIPHGPEPRRA